ncbi:hypothetical protein Csa_007465, partial [Cucumis sativus]
KICSSIFIKKFSFFLIHQTQPENYSFNDSSTVHLKYRSVLISFIINYSQMTIMWVGVDRCFWLFPSTIRY